MGATIVSSGERIANDINQITFVHGAYNLGPIYEKRTLVTTAVHPGEIIIHVQTVGGEDSYLIMPDKSDRAYGAVELDFKLIDLATDDYTITVNDIPAIPFHMNPGAYLRNIQCADPDTVDVTPDHPLHTNSGVAGSLKALTEVALVDPAGAGTGEAFNSGVVIGDLGATIMNRTPMRQAYFLTDPSAVYTTVAYISMGG